MNKLLYRITAGLPARLINLDEGVPYLERYYVGQLFGVTFYLHRFVSSDRERHVHNHPWRWGRALVLSGGYDEEVPVDLCPHASPSGCVTETRKVRWWNKVDGGHFHRISNAAPGTWTLFFHGPKQRINKGHCSKLKGWGFLENVYALGLHNVTVFTPWPVQSGEWWKDAKLGRDVGREPLPPRVGGV
ncbi:hypothetical protein K0U83_23420 [bacterium]|nr:hypothetical protein [bacterium]